MNLPIFGGYALVARQICDSQIWRDDPNLLKLWIYLFCKARHNKEPKKYNGFEINRGEMVTSLSIIADENEYLDHGRLKKWSRQQVARLLEKLVSGGCIELKADTYGTHIKIINYDIYQNPDNYKADSRETAERQPRDSRVTGSGQAADTYNNGNNGNNENREQKKNIVLPEKTGQEVGGENFYLTAKKKRLCGKRLKSFERFWKAFAYPKGKANAADAWLAIPELTNEIVEKIIKSAEAEASNRPEVIASGKVPKMAQGWITGRRWEDEVQSTNKPKPKWPEWY